MGKDGHSIQAVAGRKRESGDLGPTLDSDTQSCDSGLATPWLSGLRLLPPVNQKLVTNDAEGDSQWMDRTSLVRLLYRSECQDRRGGGARVLKEERGSTV